MKLRLSRRSAHGVKPHGSPSIHKNRPTFNFRCDECLKGFHFQCLDPPVKKSPKVRGYSWHCANCDPTVSCLLMSVVLFLKPCKIDDQ